MRGPRSLSRRGGRARRTGGRLPTAIIAYNDLCAFGVLDVFARRGIDVPGDVSIVGFDNVPEASMDHLSLTTVEQCSSALALAVSEVVVSAAIRLRGLPPAVTVSLAGAVRKVEK